MVEGLLGEVALAADPVHDLQAGILLADLDDEAHEVARLLVEAERVQGPEAEGRVADPTVTVVPVAFAAGRLRQRCGGGGQERAARCVGQPLQHQGGTLQVDAPGMVGEFARPQPFAPELFGRVEALERLGRAARPSQVAIRPGDRAEAGLLLAQPEEAARRSPLERELHVTGQLQLDAVGSARHRAAELAAAPARGFDAVAEARRALHLHLDLAVDAGHHPQQRAVGLVRGFRTAAGAAFRRPLADREQVVDDDPAGLGHPGCLDHQRARLVAAADRHDHASRGELEVAGPAIEHRGEGARRVEAGEAQPLDRAVVGDERAGVAIGEEAVAADRWEAMIGAGHRGSRFARGA